MNADLKRLIRLQAVDVAIRELSDKTAAFPARSKALDDQLSAAQQGVAAAQSAIQDNQNRRKALEAKVADIETKVSRYREQLMSVKTNDEYRAMTKEIEYSQTAVSREEDQILALMVEFEQLELDLESAETVLREDEKTVRAERSSLEDLNAQDQKTLDAYREERQDLERQIDDDVLSRYEKVRRLRGGIAMAPAVDEACEICKVRMRPQSFQEVRKNEGIITCDSCGRILYDPENLDHPFEVA